MMFFYSCSQWPSCFSNVDLFTVFTWYLINHFWLFLVTDGTGVSPDKGFQRRAGMSINSMLIFGCIIVINIVFVST